MTFNPGDLVLTAFDVLAIVNKNGSISAIHEITGDIITKKLSECILFPTIDRKIDRTEAGRWYFNKYIKSLTLPIWVTTIMNTAQTPITSNIPATSTPPPTGYPIGTVLHGTNTRIGNLWIITLDNSYQASLLYDGRTGTATIDSAVKRDTMSPGMRIATNSEILAKVGLGGLRSWAQAFYFGSGQFTKPTQAPKYIPLKMGIIQNGLGITPPEEKNLAPAPT